MVQLQQISKRAFAVFQNLGTLTLLAIAFPINCIVVSILLLWNFLGQPFSKPVVVAENPKTILLAGGRMTKTLQLARSFHAAGHRAILVDIHKYWMSGHRFSNAVAGYYTVPEPQKDLEGYAQAMRAIVKQENVDVFIPIAMFAVNDFDSNGKQVLAGYCDIFHFEPDVVTMLDDKFAFAEKARFLGLSVPKSFKITAPEQVINFDFSQEKHKYILKSIPYDCMRRLNMTLLPCDTPEQTATFVNSLPISEEKPWIMQEFIPGQEYCTHSTVRDGQIRLHCCCKSSAFQVNYENVDKPEILEWISHFVKGLGTGQASFDIIQAVNGTVYPIECNPRTHSAITMFYNHPGVAAAYLDQEPLAEPLQPLPDSKPTYWLYHEVWRLTGIRSFKQLPTWIRNILRGKEAIFSVSDPLPFLMVYHWHIPLLLLDNLRRLKGWIRIDFNLGELIESN